MSQYLGLCIFKNIYITDFLIIFLKNYFLFIHRELFFRLVLTLNWFNGSNRRDSEKKNVKNVVNARNFRMLIVQILFYEENKRSRKVL